MNENWVIRRGNYKDKNANSYKYLDEIQSYYSFGMHYTGKEKRDTAQYACRWTKMLLRAQKSLLWRLQINK